MSNFDTWALSLVVFIPTVAALVIAATPKARDGYIKLVALAGSGASLVISLVVLAKFHFHQTRTLQFPVDKSWISTIGARYHMAIDGISLPLLIMTTVIVFLAVLYSQKIVPPPGKPKGFFTLILLLATGMEGTFVALDLVLFFIFWELVLVPM